MLVWRYIQAKERSRVYCHKEELRYTWMWRIDVATKRDTKLNAQQAAYWKKESHSIIPIHPTQGEEDCWIECSQDEQIRQLIKDYERSA